MVESMMDRHLYQNERLWLIRKGIYCVLLHFQTCILLDSLIFNYHTLIHGDTGPFCLGSDCSSFDLSCPSTSSFFSPLLPWPLIS